MKFEAPDTAISLDTDLEVSLAIAVMTRLVIKVNTHLDETEVAEIIADYFDRSAPTGYPRRLDLLNIDELADELRGTVYTKAWH